MTGQTILLESVQKLLRRNADKNLARILDRTRSEDIARLMRHFTGRDAFQIFSLIEPHEKRSECMAELDPELQTDLAEHITDPDLLELLREMSGDDAADVIERLPDDRAAAILAMWKDEQAQEIDSLLAYGPDTAGGIMTPHVFALHEDTTCGEAISTLQEQHEELDISFYLYVVNDHGQLVGVCSLRQLVVTEPDTPLSTMMDSEVLSVHAEEDQEEVARLVARYNFLAIPVVDGTNKLVGVVTVDDVIDVIREEATEDILMMAGAGSTDFSDLTDPVTNARQRMPWLLASFVGGLGSMFIIGAFESSLNQVTALAAFIPITLGMGGNVGTQASTVVTRGLALGRIPTSKFKAVVRREILTGVMLGLTYGAAVGVVATARYGWADAPYAIWRLSLTVGAAMGACMTTAAAVGGAVPMVMHKIGVDPAVATGPFVTTSVDIIGITTYFLIAQILLGI
jgi:magnesium transporter